VVCVLPWASTVWQDSAATYGHDAITLKLALTDAQRRLSQLYGGPGFEALQAQMEIIRHNLAAEHPGLDQGLWIPLRAEVERFLWRAPEQVRAAARSAVEKGRAAASMHERKAAREQIEVLLDALQYRVQVFPLRKVREDVDSAIMSGFLPTPDWEATRQALDSALGQVRWFTRERAYGLLDAYLQVANAYTAWPDTQKVTDYLKQAADDLAGAPEEQTLVTALRDAAQNPTQKAVADLLSALHGQIQTDQQPGLQGSVGGRSPHGPPLARARTEKALWLGFATGLETAV